MTAADDRGDISLDWLIRLRWGAVAGQLATIGVAQALWGGLPLPWLLAPVAVLAASNAALAATRRLHFHPRLLCGAALTLALGLLALTPGSHGAAPPALAATAPLRLGVAGAANSGVSLAAQGATVVATWAARSGSATDVYAAWSRDGGATFGEPVRVNDVPGDARVSGEQAPRIVLGEGARVVWLSRAADASVVRTAAARPGAKTFVPTATIHPDGLKGARGWASLAAGPGAAAQVAWLDGRGNAGQDLFHAVLQPDGTRLETRLATNVCFCCKTAVATGPGGTVYVAWRHIYPPNLRDIAVARSDDGGRTFGAAVRVSEDGWAIDGCPDDGPAIGVDGRGALHVVWPTLASPGGSKGVFYTRSDDGGRSFARRTRVDEAPAGAAHPQLAVDGGRVLVAWDEVSEGRRRACLREVSGAPAAPGGPRLGPTTMLSAGPALYPAVAAAPDAVIAAWTEEEGSSSVIRLSRIAR